MGLFDQIFGGLLGQNFDRPSEPGDRETFEVIKGNYQTKLTVLFDKDGRFLGTRVTCNYVPNEEELKKLELEKKISLLENQKSQAIEAEDFAEAARLRDEIKLLREPTAQE